MNAPQVKADESIRGGVMERAHAHIISAYLPNCDETELAARCDLAVIRDGALTGVGRAEQPAATMLAEVARVAQDAVYADLPTSRLIRIRAALNFAMEAARAVDQVMRNG